MDKAFAKIKQDQLNQMPQLTVQLMSQVLDLAKDFMGRQAQIGPQEALLEILPTAGIEREKRANLTTDELVSLSVFQLQVRVVARNFLGASSDEEELIVQGLEPADCLGSWLEWALRRRTRSASADPQPNHQHDAERLAYLPYVDLLLTDRQMVEFFNQIRREKSTPVEIRNVQPPLAVPSSLRGLEIALDKMVGRQNGE